MEDKKMVISPHTFELTLDLRLAQYEELREAAYAKAEGSHRFFVSNRIPDLFHKVYIDTALSAFGITIEYHESYTKHSIKFIVNPSKVLGGDDIPKLWKPTDRNIKALLRNLRSCIKDYFNSEYKLRDFKLTRIDLTANVDVGSREKVSQYIKALHGLGTVKGFLPKYKKSDRRIDKALSFDLKGKSRSIEFSAYDKEAQSEKQAAKGILRVEIRLMRIKLAGDNDVADHIRTLSKQSRELFMSYFQRIVPRGDFYAKKQAAKLVEDGIAAIIPDKRAREPMLEKMLKLLDLVPKKKSLLLALDELGYRDTFRLMATFAELGVSPVTLSKNMKLKHMESLYSFLEA
jgi:hypothetical protein